MAFEFGLFLQGLRFRLKKRLFHAAVSDRAHAQMVVFLEIRLEVVHINDRDALGGIRFSPGTGAAGPAELAERSVVMTHIFVHQGAHAVAVAVTGEVAVGEIAVDQFL